MSEVKQLKAMLKDLEKRVEKLENKGPQGTRLKQIAEWIMELFDEKEVIPIHTIMVKGKKKGYSEQMIQRARRQLLDDKVGYSVKRGEGWSWIKTEE